MAQLRGAEANVGRARRARISERWIAGSQAPPEQNRRPALPACGEAGGSAADKSPGPTVPPPGAIEPRAPRSNERLFRPTPEKLRTFRHRSPAGCEEHHSRGTGARAACGDTRRAETVRGPLRRDGTGHKLALEAVPALHSGANDASPVARDSIPGPPITRSAGQ
jgi:hypothetical protein